LFFYKKLSLWTAVENVDNKITISIFIFFFAELPDELIHANIYTKFIASGAFLKTFG